LYDPASKVKAKKKKNNFTFGWDVFNDDTLYKSYFKRCKNMPETMTTDELKNLLSDGGKKEVSEDQLEEARKQMMVEELDKQREKRG
jgi:site-specific recombinase XerD